MKPKILDLGCWINKYPGAFGVDFTSYKNVDFVWDLNKQLPRKFHNKFDIVYSNQVLDHIGNPLIFLQGCYKYLKKKGKLILKIDNGDYWRFHVKLGNYHADIFEIHDTKNPKTHHKMLFQKKGLVKMLKTIGFNVESTRYYRTYDRYNFIKRLKMGHIDLLFPKHLGCNMIEINAIKP